MIIRTAFAVAVIGFTSLSAAQAAPRQNHMSGQSAAAGTAFDADRRAEFVERRQPMGYGYEMMAPARSGSMMDDPMFDRAARPDRQR